MPKSKKEHLIVGDIHGCLHTLQALLKKWKPNTQQLIFVGDLVDHGNFCPQVVELAFNLKDEEPDSILIRGNHEEYFYKHVLKQYNEEWFQKSGERTFSQYLYHKRRIEPDAELFKKMPLYYQTPYLLVSHAGVCETAEPFNPDNVDSVLYQRNVIKKLEQLQVYGHTPVEKARYDEATHAICIDTGAYKYNKLSAIVVNTKGDIKDLIEQKTHHNDEVSCEEIKTIA
jgi:serine/threonine protein phosphatase 1